jgi:transcription antitermination factor NusG
MNINHIEITQIKSIIAKATIEELRMLNETIINTIKYKRTLEASVKKVGLSVGMMVRVNHPKLAGQELSVNKINRTKATLSVKSGKCFVVPISLIEY